MANVVKTVKTDYKLKGVSIVNGKFVAEDGEVVDLVKDLTSVFGEAPFDLTSTKSTKEELEIDELEEVDISEVSPDVE